MRILSILANLDPEEEKKRFQAELTEVRLETLIALRDSGAGFRLDESKSIAREAFISNVVIYAPITSIHDVREKLAALESIIEKCKD